MLIDEVMHANVLHGCAAELRQAMIELAPKAVAAASLPMQDMRQGCQHCGSIHISCIGITRQEYVWTDKVELVRMVQKQQQAVTPLDWEACTGSTIAKQEVDEQAGRCVDKLAFI